jgi:thiol-disulfide isomerase/thioredoxin
MPFRFLSIFVFLVGSLIAFAYYSSSQKSLQKDNNTITMPNFSAFSLDSVVVNSTKLNPNFSNILIHFNSTCDHCQYEAQELLKNKEKFEKTNIILFSSEKLPTLNVFYKTYQLHKIPNLQIWKSHADTLQKYFGKLSTPHVFIYNAKKELIKSYQGETKIEAILKYISPPTPKGRANPNKI